jgi:predicted neuraminidase
MKTSFFVLLVGFGMKSAAQDIPSNLPYTLLDSGFIYERAPFPSCHASTLVETDSGLLAAWFGGTHEKNPDVCIYTANYTNGKWSLPLQTADGRITDKQRYPCWNPVLFRKDNGEVILYYKVGRSPSQWWGMYRISADNGASWTPAVKIPNGLLGPIKNKPFRLADGRILYPTSFETNTRWRVYTETSAQDLTQWVKTPIDNNGFNAIQPAILSHPDGILQLLCRSTNGIIVQTWSTDMGKTWSPLDATELPNNNAGIDGVTLQNGLHLLVCNPMKEGRNRLVVLVSSDGEKWQNLLVLEDHDDGEYSYPAIIQGKDGRIHITYTYLREKIKYVCLVLKNN